MIERIEHCWCGSGIKKVRCHNTQSPPRSVIIINGHPNSGKSAIRNAIFRKLNKIHFYEYCFDSRWRIEVSKHGKDTEGILNAYMSALLGIVDRVGNRSVVSDALCNYTNIISSLREKLEQTGARVLLVRLHCDIKERKRRDGNRRKDDPGVAYGFNESLNPEPDSDVYDVEIDTTQRDISDVAEQILCLARSTLWT